MSLRRYGLLFLAALLMALMFSRPALAADWAKNFDATASGAANIYATAVDSAGNSYVAGYFTGATTTWGATTLTKAGTQDAFVAKLDAAGSVLWAKSYGGAGAYAQANAIAVDAAGNVYLGGYFTAANLTAPALTKISLSDAFALKLDASGNTTWAKNYGSSAQVFSIAIDAAGNVYLGGTFSGASLIADAVNLVRIGNYDAFALKLDGSGTAVWGSNFGGTAGVSAYVNAIAVDTSGNVYLGGYFQNADLTTPALTLIGIGGQDAFAIKLNSSGATTWAKNFGGTAGAGARVSAIAVDAAGNVYLGGFISNADLTTPALTLIGTQDAFAFKLDGSGNTLWAKNFGGAGAASYAKGIAVDAAGKVNLGGSFMMASLTAPALTKIGTRDAFAFKLDGSGTVTLAKNFGGAGAQAGINAVAADAAGNIYLGGYLSSGNLTTPPVTRIGGSDALILKQAMLPMVTSIAPTSGGVSGGTVVTLSGTDFSGATAVNFGANAGTALTVNSDTSITVTAPASTTGAGAVDVTVTTPAGTGGTGNGLFTYAITAPAQPAAPTVTLAGNLATVSFTAPAANGSAITGYTVATSPAGGVDLEAGTTATTHHIVGLAAGTAYDFNVVASNAIGSSTASSSASASTPASYAAMSFGSLGASTAIYATAVDSAGNRYVSGYFYGASLTLGATTLTRIGASDAFVAKLDAAGSVLWAKNYGGAGADASARAIAVDAAGNVYLGGQFATADLTTPALTQIGWGDAFALKLDSSGATLWSKNYGGAGTGAAVRAIAVDASGNVYLGGQAGYHVGSADLTTPALTRIGTYDAFAFKLDSGGATLWAKSFGGAGASAYANAIAVDASGNVVLGGSFSVADLSTPVLARTGNSDAFALKLDSSGATAWSKNYGGAGANAGATGIAVDASGNVYVGGVFGSADLTAPTLARIGNSDAFVFKLDSSGATAWSKNYGGAGANTYTYTNTIAVDTSGNVYLGGSFDTANLTTPALTRIGTTDAFALKLDSSGAATWSKNYGGAGADADAYGFAVDVSGNVSLGGRLRNANLTTPALTRIGTWDAFFLKSATPPSAPTGVSASAGNGQATVSFGAPANSTVSGYTVVSSPAGGVDSNAGSTALSHTVTGLTNGTAYTFTVTASNAAGTGPASAASNAVTPSVPAPDPGPAAPTEVSVSTPGQNVTAQAGLPLRIAAGANVDGATISLPANAPITVELGAQRFVVTAQATGTQLALRSVVIDGRTVLALVLSAGSARIVAGGTGETLLVLGDGATPVQSGTANAAVDVKRAGATTILSVGSGFVVLPGAQRTPRRAASPENGIPSGQAEYRVYAGERATLNAAGQVTSHVLGNENGDGAGDALTLELPANLSMATSVPKLDAVAARLGKSVLQALAEAAGATASAQSSSGTVALDLAGQRMYVLPLGEVVIDTDAVDGAKLGADGTATVAAGGVVARFAPSVADLGQLARDMGGPFPWPAVAVGADGVLKAVIGGTSYVLRPAWATWEDAAGTPGFATDAQGGLTYRQDGRAYALHAAVADWTRLAAAVEQALPGATLTTHPDGTVTLASGAQRWTLTPQMQLKAPSEETRQWWVEADGTLRLRNADGTTQGFTAEQAAAPQSGAK